MKFDVNAISRLLKAQIEGFESQNELSDVGTVVSVGDDIASVYGLSGAMLGELLLFPHDIYGLVMNLGENSLDAAILNGDLNLKEGDWVKRTKRVVEVPVGDALLGRVVGALGNPIDGLGPISSNKTRPIERMAPGILPRKSVDTSLFTGLRAIDAMVPIGRGQRELIIGDRQSGKTSIAVDAIISQKGRNVKCVYCAIGQKNSSVAYIADRLKREGCMDYSLIISASSSEPAPQLYVAPYAAMAMAEEWMENGQDVLIVFDDLSKHAVAYRTLSLLLRRSPGREAYPGDIFYLHSRLLERACRLDEKHGGGSITALPIVETQEGDISAYIPTNVISITDGQIYLSTDMFNEGFRPAVDSGLSVSRVGSSAQDKAMKKVASSLKIELANYRENLSFAQFGSDLDAETQKILSHGAVLSAALIQKEGRPEKLSKEASLLYCVKEGCFDEVKAEKVPEVLEGFHEYLINNYSKTLEAIESEKDLSEESMKDLKVAAAHYREEVGGF